MLKKLSRSFALIVVPFLGALLIRFLGLTNKKVFHAPKDISDESVVIAFWHGELLMMPYMYRFYRKDNVRAKVIISEHFDGNLIAKTLSYFGLGTIRGSSTRGGVKALIESLKCLKQGYDIGITPDGPKGPRHSVSDGMIVMAKKADVKVVFVEIIPSKYWQLRSWDKFTIPKPFGRIDYYISEAYDIKDMELEEARTFIQKGLLNHER